MRLASLIVLISLALSACSQKEIPPKQASPANPQQSELAQILGKYEAAVDEMLASRTVILANLDPGLREKLENRSTLNEEDRLANLEAFVDAYIAAMRRYIRKETLVENYVFKTIEMFPQQARRGDRREASVSLIEEHLGLKDLPAGETLLQRVERIDSLQLQDLQAKMRDHRKTLSPLERAKLCVVRTRYPDGSFRRYRSILSITVAQRYSPLGEELENLGIRGVPSMPEKIPGQSLKLSPDVQSQFESVGYTGTPTLMIADQLKWDPADDTNILRGWQHTTIFFFAGDAKRMQKYFFTDLNKAVVLSSEEGKLTVRSPVAFSGEETIPGVGSATVEVSLRNGDFEISKVTLDEIKNSREGRKLHLQFNTEKAALEMVELRDYP